MSIPDKQDLLQAIEHLPSDYYGQVLDFMRFLERKQEHQNPLIAFAGVLADTDLSEPEDPIPESFDFS